MTIFFVVSSFFRESALSLTHHFLLLCRTKHLESNKLQNKSPWRLSNGTECFYLVESIFLVQMRHAVWPVRSDLWPSGSRTVDECRHWVHSFTGQTHQSLTQTHNPLCLHKRLSDAIDPEPISPAQPGEYWSIESCTVPGHHHQVAFKLLQASVWSNDTGQHHCLHLLMY